MGVPFQHPGSLHGDSGSVLDQERVRVRIPIHIAGERTLRLRATLLTA
jgi:hypothetical protein